MDPRRQRRLDRFRAMQHRRQMIAGRAFARGAPPPPPDNAGQGAPPAAAGQGAPPPPAAAAAAAPARFVVDHPNFPAMPLDDDDDDFMHDAFLFAAPVPVARRVDPAAEFAFAAMNADNDAGDDNNNDNPRAAAMMAHARFFHRHVNGGGFAFGGGGDDNNDDDDEEAQEGRNAADISPMLSDMIKTEHTCTSVLSAGEQTCANIVARCTENQDEAFYCLSLTGRSPLHEACLRNTCIHVVRVLLQANPQAATKKDLTGNTPLHLLFMDHSYRSVDPNELDEIARLLLEVNPTTIASTNNGEGNNALHLACNAPESMILPATIERIIAAHPDCAKQINSRCQTPLSTYCKQRHASPQLAQILLQAHPEATGMLDLGGWTPLHDAANNSNTALIRFLVDQAPNAASIRTRPDSRTALQLLCMQNPRDAQIPAIEALLEAAPESLEMTDSRQNQTPLHIYCKHPRMSLNVVRLLTNVQVAATTDAEHYTPLHHACENGATVEIVEHFLQVHERASKVITRKQDTPLHIACGANQSVGTVRLLIQANPDALIMKNDYGFTPLHCVCRAYQPRMGIVQALLEANPSTVTLRTHGGETPVHLACSSGAFVGVLQLLTQAQTAVSGSATTPRDLLVEGKMMNKIGNTPLHEACFRATSSFEHIETLARSNPDWIVIRNNAGYTPLQIMCKGGRLDERIVNAFARIRGPEVFSVIDAGGHTPLHSASREGTSIEAIRSLIRAYPDALYLKTTYGDTPLHLACLRGATVEVVQYLAEASSERHSPLLEPNTAGQTPIGIVQEQYQVLCRLGCCVTTSRTELVRCFNVLSALVKIVFYGASYEATDARPASLVRACVSIHRKDVRLDPAFIRRAIHLHPEEVRLMDEDGNYPLHIEASIPIEKMCLLDANVEGCCSGTCHKRMGILDMLLETYPDACRVRNKGDAFPLGLMMANGRPWNKSFARALREFPPALHWYHRGLDERLMPLIIKRVADECGVDTLFNFLNSKPEVVARKR